MSNETKRQAMVVDLGKCTGCHACTVACKVENEVPPAVWRSWVKVLEKGVYPNAVNLSMPVMCNNCENAICVRVCPTKASYKRDDGIVMIDPHKCTGCKYCMAACPYQARYLNPVRKYAQKCYFCSHRVDQGLLPACVEACPSGAIIFGDMNDPGSEVAKALIKTPVAILKAEAGTNPSVFYVGLDMDLADPLKGIDIEHAIKHDHLILEEIFHIGG
jgi:tetrathionate reductase subunit B